jgi:lipopolysaccharide transport system permease protein
MQADVHPTASPARPAPERTVVAGRPRPVFDLREILRHRDLLYFLTRRQVLSRYKQAVLGVLWAVIQPVVTMIVFSIVLGGMAGVPSEGVPYPVFAYLGILPWQLFAAGIGRSTSSIAANANLITKVYFPRVLLPVSGSLASLADFAIAFLVLIALMLGHGMLPSPATLLLVPLLAVTLLIATGIGMGLGAINVRYRDVGHAVPFLLQAWMLLTPVVYPLELVPERWRLVMALNPASGPVQATRDLVLGRAVDLGPLGVSLAVGLALTALGAAVFRRTERTFADLV